MTVYDKGDVLRVTAAYTNSLAVAVDPAVVKFSFKDPFGNVTTYTYLTNAELVRSAAGVFYADVHFTLSGSWFVRHWSTGTGEASSETEYYVKQSAFG